MIQLLSLEYETLRSEILTRTSGRYQFLGLMTTAAALLASGIGSTISASQKLSLGCLALAIFTVGLAYFWRLGGHIVLISARIAEIENRINELLVFTVPAFALGVGASTAGALEPVQSRIASSRTSS